jgi:GTPase SAR1 family protein
MGTTWGDTTCGCTVDTLPHPRIVLLGPTGVGKSTLGNRLFNITPYNQNEALCSQSEWTRDETGAFVHTPRRFRVGHGADPMTNNTSWMVGHYLGDPANPCITVIDTPGTGDTEGKDCERGIALAEEIKQMGSIDAFIFLFKGTNPRFTQAMQDQIKLYMSIFGQKMWQSTITEFTFWRHDERSIRERERNRGSLNEVTQDTRWNKEYTDRFGVSQPIPSIFIDPVYDGEYADNKEKEIFEKDTDKLWNLITNDLTTFKCDNRCQAPSEFFCGPAMVDSGEHLAEQAAGRSHGDHLADLVSWLRQLCNTELQHLASDSRQHNKGDI